MCNRLRRSRWLGLLFAAHFKAGHARRLFSGILHAGLLFSAHFFIADVPVFIAIPLIFCFLSAVVIVCTFFTVYRRFPRVSTTADKENAGLLSTAQFYVQRFSFGFQIAYPPTAQANTTWPAKFSPRPPQKNFHPPRCYPAHISKILKILSNFLRPLSHSKIIFCGQFMAVDNNRGPLLLSAAQFQIACLPSAKSFAAPSDCYSAHILPQ